jgi:apolipoprotein N-acyltransferase
VASLSLVVLFGGWRYGRLEDSLREAPVKRFQQMQFSLTMQEVMQRRHRNIIRVWVLEPSRIKPGTVDVVVWPEGAGPHLNYDWRTFDPFMRKLARDGQYELVLGVGKREPIVDEETGKTRNVSYNSVVLLDKTGEYRPERYDKMVPLPFGEYIPFESTFPWLRDFIKGPGAFKAGEFPTVIEGDGLRIAAPLCYEAILSHVCNQFENPNIIINVTNDAWFGTTDASAQHSMLAAVRAMELGVPLFRSAYTGISMVVEPHGRIRVETELFEHLNRQVNVRMGTFPTFYSRFGEWFVWACGVFFAICVFLARRRANGTEPSVESDNS